MGGSSSKEEANSSAVAEKKNEKSGNGEEKDEEKKPVNHLKELERKRLREIQTPNQGLQAACVQGDADAVRRYVAPASEGGGADVNHRDLGPVPPEGKGPDDPEYKQLMKDVIITEDYPLHMAVEHGHEKVCELLFYLDAKLENRNRMGSTALHRAVSMQKPNVVKWLLDKKCDIGAKNNIGNTALHIAAYTGNVEIAKMLLEAGAHRHVRVPNKVEMTPLDYARKSTMIDLLTRWRPDGSVALADGKTGHAESKEGKLAPGESFDAVPEALPVGKAMHLRTNSGSTSNSSVAISVISDAGAMAQNAAAVQHLLQPSRPGSTVPGHIASNSGNASPISTGVPLSAVPAASP